MTKKNIGLLMILALVVIMLVGYIKKEATTKEAIVDPGYEVELTEKQGVGQGQIAPDFTLKTLDGESVTLSALKGKKVILNFWASWCPPCKAEMPHLQSYYDQYAEEDNVVLLAANATFSDKGAENVQTFVNSYKLTFPILLMEDESVVNLYQVLSLPTTYFIDTEGRIQRQFIGPLDENALKNYVQALN
ncbi:TlpA family protein disulfide reductase [Lysinibacillus sp. 54212]|uniref:TlpA family protein disulfide reductase n=1 Tax=Lysinibacillus sp. 54212 TaxID=3119829 RepID=UPI002FC8F1EC